MSPDLTVPMSDSTLQAFGLLTCSTAAISKNEVHKLEKLTKGGKTKRLLYECAIELFQEKGYDKVSVDEIVKKAGMAKGTFYIYFESKAAIITQMLQEYDDYYSTVAAQMDPNTPASERLELIVRSSCQFTKESIGVDLLRALYMEQLLPGRSEQDALNSNRALYRIIHELLVEGQQSGIYRTDFDINKMGAWLIRCIRGTFYEWCIQEGRFDLCDECVQFVHAFFCGLEWPH